MCRLSAVHFSKVEIKHYSAMKKSNYSIAILALAVIAPAFSSCENEEYDVEDLNTEVTLVSEGLTLPLGTTKQLTLKNMLSSMDEDMLQVLDGGAYALRINDELSLGDQLPALDEMIEIPDVEFSQKTTFSLSEIDSESLSIDGQEFDYSFELAEEGLVPDVVVPEIFVEEEQHMGIWEYGKSAREMEVEVADVHLMTGKLFSLPAGLSDAVEGDITIGDLPEAVVEPVSVNVVVKSEAPEGITNISDVKMTESSMMKITLSVQNSFISKGNIVPDMNLDLGGLITLEGDKESIDIDDDFILDEDNGYSATKTYHIETVNIAESDWEESVLEMKRAVEVSGKAVLKAAVTNADKIAAATGGMSLKVDVEFVDVAIESVEMDIDDIEVTEKMEIPVALEDIALPEGVKNVEKVVFKENSHLDLVIKLENISEIAGMETTLKTLEMIFPEEMTVRDAVDGKLVFSDIDLSKGLTKEIHVDQITFPAPVNGKISYTADVKVNAVMVAGGRICSADVPYTEESDGIFLIDAESHFEIDDYYVEIDGLEHELEVEPQEFTYELPDGIADIGTFSIVPEGSPVLVVELELPQTSLAVEAAETGLCISFPEFLRFKDVDSSYGFDAKTNSIVLKGQLPEKINLPIDRVTVTPKVDDQTGKYYAGGSINVDGAVAVASGTVTGKDVEAIASSSISVKATVPSIVAEEILFEHFEVAMNESFDFEILKAGTLPEEVKGVSSVVLSDVEATIDVAVKNLPDLGTDPSVDFVITLPEMLVLDKDDARVKDGTVTVSGKIRNGKVDIAPIGISAIDLSGYDFSSGKDLTGVISIEGCISADNPELDLESLKDDMILTVEAGIKDIEIARIEANVAYEIEGIDEQVALTGLPDFMKGEDFVLDLANPHLIIKAKTNMGIPVKGDLMINPVIGGVINEDGQIKASISLPYTETASETDSVMFWFGGDKSRCPADYTFVEADINKLIRRIPDELQLSLTAGTDQNISCVVEPSADYTLDIEYDFVIPLEFGEDLHIEISDTLDGLPDILGQILEKNAVQLAGSITSSLPLALEMKIDMLDLNDKVIPLDKDAVQTISACGSNGEAAKSPLNLTLDVKKGASVAGLSSLKLTFTVTSPNLTGIPVDECDYVQADIKLALPEGITVDVADLNSDQN